MSEHLGERLFLKVTRRIGAEPRQLDGTERMTVQPAGQLSSRPLFTINTRESYYGKVKLINYVLVLIMKSY